MIEPITLTITTCDRNDLLEQTLSSFFRLNTYPIKHFIMINDSGDALIHQYISERYGQQFKILNNPIKLGLSKSIDILFNAIETEYFFHLEDDWFFDGNPNFIQDSLDILQTEPNIHHVWVRHENDLLTNYPNGLPFNIINQTYKVVPKIDSWNGFSFNPGLRRKSDYNKMFPDGMSIIGDELKCAIHTEKFSYKSVILNSTSCYHIGKERTKNFKH